MLRTKSYVTKPPTVADQAVPTTAPAGRRLLQRAAVAAPAKPAPPKVTANKARTNLTAEPAAAVVVPQGAPASQGELEVIGPGATISAPSGNRIAGFIHGDGSAVQFVGDGGGIFLPPPVAAREFGSLVPTAREMLHSEKPAAAKPAVAKPVAAKPIQRWAESDSSPSSTAAVDAALKSGSGQSLPARNRSRLEASYGTGLGDVRIHTDAAADRAAESIQAKAFTSGKDVYFKAGQYQPGSTSGDHLLAHEVAHTVQQGSGTSGISKKSDHGDFQISDSTDFHEREADQAAGAAMRGQRADITSLAGAPVVPIIARFVQGGPGPAAAPSPAPAPATGAPGPAKAGPGPAPAGGAGGPGAAQAAAPAAGGEVAGGPTPQKQPAAADGPGGKPAAAGPAGAEKTEGGPAAKNEGKAAEADSGAGLAEVVGEVNAAGKEERTHESVGEASADTVKAADVTPDEAAGKARGDQVEKMAAQKKGTFNRDQFKASLRAKIKALQADEAKGIKDGDKAQGINDAVKGGVAQEKQAAAGPINQVAKQPPAAGEPKAGDKLPETPKGEAPQVDGAKAVPGPVPEEKRSLAPESQAVDQKMADAKVTPEQLTKANEPTFQAAADAHATAKTEADALPDKAKTAEAQVLDNSRAQAAQTAQAGLAGMHGERSDKLQGGQGEKEAGKAKYEETRARISKQLGGIYDATAKEVETRMATLDKDVETTFDDGASSAKLSFYAFLGTRLLVYYATGGWLVDAFTGGDSKEEIFKEGRDQYLADMEVVIDRVADVVEVGLNDVVAIIERGRVQLEDALKQFGPEDAAIANEVAGGLRDKFASLEQSVQDKQAELVESLAKKFVAAQKDVDSTINALRDPVGALIDMAIDAVAGVIETIMKMKELLTSALAKAGEAIDLILADPIAFLGYLVAGVKQGVEGFLANIGTYLQKGLLDWLFGALAQAGIQMPEKFDLSGLLSIVLQVLGLTWTNIRQRAVAIVGEPVVKALETASEIFIVLATKGAAGLWEYIKEQAAALMETLKEGVKSFIMESVIVAGVKWLIGLLNPASAFVKACMAIYDIVTFIINKGQQILAFVNAVLDSILSIAKGDISPAAKAVEGALAKAIPVAIGFLASLLGVGDLGEKIKKVIDKIQAPINKVIDWLIKKAVALVKAIGKMLGVGGKNKDEATTAEEDAEVKEPFNMGSHGHTLTARAKKGQLVILIASTEMVLQSALTRALNQVQGDEQFPNRKQIIKRLEQAIALSDYNFIMQDWHNKQQPGRFPDFLKRSVLKIVASLSDLGGLGIESLDELFGRMKRGNGPYSHLADTEDVGPKKDFTAAQRRVILEANRLKHGVSAPFAVSDRSKVPLDDSLPASHANKPNIDHMMPRSEGGPNSYSNAMVLARDENQAKGATIEGPLPYELKEQPPSKPTVIRRPGKGNAKS